MRVSALAPATGLRYVLRMTTSKRGDLVVSPWAVRVGKEKGGPPKGPAFQALSGYLPNDPACQKTTNHEQDTGAERY
jgi:hypothetical protein